LASEIIQIHLARVRIAKVRDLYSWFVLGIMECFGDKLTGGWEEIFAKRFKHDTKPSIDVIKQRQLSSNFNSEEMG
jgi:hypothetical protein